MIGGILKEIAKKEGGNLFIIELAALLHDIDDYKFNNGDDKAGGKAARILFFTKALITPI